MAYSDIRSPIFIKKWHDPLTEAYIESLFDEIADEDVYLIDMQKDIIDRAKRTMWLRTLTFPFRLIKEMFNNGAKGVKKSWKQQADYIRILIKPTDVLVREEHELYLRSEINRIAST